MYSHCDNPYLLCTLSVWLAPPLPVVTLICLLFQCFLSCTHCITVDALLLSSLLAVFMSCNVQDKHNRRAYNVENLEVSMMVFFPFSLAAQFPQGELGRIQGRSKHCKRMAHAVCDG